MPPRELPPPPHVQFETALNKEIRLEKERESRISEKETEEENIWTKERENSLGGYKGGLTLSLSNPFPTGPTSRPTINPKKKTYMTRREITDAKIVNNIINYNDPCPDIPLDDLYIDGQRLDLQNNKPPNNNS